MMKRTGALITSLAFILAVASALAATPRQNNISLGTIVVKGKAAFCPQGSVSDLCQLVQSGQVCTFQYGLFNLQAIPDDTQAGLCLDAQVLKLPMF